MALGERPQVVVGQGDALAAEPVVGRQRPAELGLVRQLALEVPARDLLEPGHDHRPARHHEVRDLHVERREGAIGALQERQAPEEAALDRRRAPVDVRQDPGGRPLEDGELGRDARDLGDHLDRGRARADHADALPGEVEVVVPAGGVHDRPGEVAEPVDVGQLGLDETARPRDEPFGEQLAGARLQPPGLLVLIPRRALERNSEADVADDALVLRAAAQVALDLVAGGEGLGPVRVRQERVRVEVRRHVAATARVRVVPPGAADAGGALEHDEVVVARAPQPDGGAEAGEARADDDGPDALRHEADPDASVCDI